MKSNDLTEEQKTKLKSCRDSEELKSMLNDMGVELTDEQLEEAAGGVGSLPAWDKCPAYIPH